MNEFELIFYRKPNGECPVQEFLASLNKVMRFKMMHALDLLEIYGNKPKGDYSRFVQDGIFEVRAQNKTDITRIFYFFDKDRKVVLTHGIVKKTQRLPLSELETARKCRADYLSREKERELAAKSSPTATHTTNGPKWRPKLDAIMAEAEARSKALGKNVQKEKDFFQR